MELRGSSSEFAAERRSRFVEHPRSCRTVGPFDSSWGASYCAIEEQLVRSRLWPTSWPQHVSLLHTLSSFAHPNLHAENGRSDPACEVARSLDGAGDVPDLPRSCFARGEDVFCHEVASARGACALVAASEEVIASEVESRAPEFYRQGTTCVADCRRSCRIEPLQSAKALARAL